MLINKEKDFVLFSERGESKSVQNNIYLALLAETKMGSLNSKLKNFPLTFKA